MRRNPAAREAYMEEVEERRQIVTGKDAELKQLQSR